MIEVDARGLSCPEPVLLTLDALEEAGDEAVLTIVSDTNQRDNVKTQAQRKGKTVSVEQKGQDWYLTIQ
ncbi:MAG: sulfurtransferase TusA family protein [Coriobacteriia bacterium]|nr:sulfurtransferase TusA family protein [Coriobacteriia bacterium]